MKKNVFRMMIGALSCLIGIAAIAEGDFSFASSQQSNYQKRTNIAPKPAGFVVTCVQTGDFCTAWGLRSQPQKIDDGTAAYAVEFEIYADQEWRNPSPGSKLWNNRIVFCDKSGNEVSGRPISLEFRAKTASRFRFAGEIPPEAKSLCLQFGVDSKPPVRHGERVEVKGATFTPIARGKTIPSEVRPDLSAPVVISDFESPSTDASLAVRYRFEDDSSIDWNSVHVTDVTARVSIPFVREGVGIRLVPGSPWRKGAHLIDIALRDCEGNAALSHKVFLIGETRRNPRVSLRDDGIVLVEGKPFFPIGIYGIHPHEFNGNDFETAIGDLRKAGLNFGHSYAYRFDPKFLSAANSHGMMMWTDGKGALNVSGGLDWFLNHGRNDRSILAWYIGDDTSMYATPGELYDRHESVRMLDGTRITCHADGVRASAPKSNFQEYVNHADVFMPEIYPIDGTKDEDCVAEVCRDMERCRADIRKYGRAGRAYGLWPILQCFHGKSWKRYPTHEEMYGMSFAALVHGGTGITWFTYGSEIGNGHSYSGMFRTGEDWAAMTNITRRIAALSLVLLERTGEQPPIPEVIAGPKTDGLGQPAVTALLKAHNGGLYLIAVNSANEPVVARFRLNVRGSEGDVAWEHRKVTVAGGAFSDRFERLGVHVYRFKRR